MSLYAYYHGTQVIFKLKHPENTNNKQYLYYSDTAMGSFVYNHGDKNE